MSKTRGCNLNSCADLVADLAAVIEQVMPLAVPRAPAVSRPPPRRESRGSRYIAQAGAAVSLCFYPCIQCFRLRFFLGAVTPLSALEMRNYPQVCLIASSMLLLLGVPVTAQPAPASSTPSTQPGTAPEQPFSNADVVKLTKLDLGNEVVIAKISQATAVDFKLDTDSLVALKQEGVSKEVIAAMLNRTSAPQIHRGTEAGSPPGNGSAPSPVFGGMTSAGDEGVILRGAQGEIRLQSVQGDISSTYIFVATLMFLDFPGLKADVKISDRRPTFVVRGSKSPRGRVFFGQVRIE